MSDAIQFCLTLSPVPCLTAAFTLFRGLWTAAENVQSVKQQVMTLADNIAQLLRTLDKQYRSGRAVEESSEGHLESLQSLLMDIAQFITTQRSRGLLKQLYGQNDSMVAIEGYHRRIGTLIQSFNITALLSLQDWQVKNRLAREQDQQTLDARLASLEANQHQLAQVLNDQHSSIMAMMVSLQKSLNKQTGSQRERHFLEHSLRYLSTTSGQHVQLDNWTITAFEVDFGPLIGSGGFGQVFRGTWNRTPVALKVLRADTGGIPSSATIRREIDTWANLRHPHVLQFLGANVLDEKPFIVMPYLKNGNARDFLYQHPTSDRIKILHHVALGLVHLHSQNVIHGDLKGLNVLLDDAGNAVLCDFGLSRVKADASSRSTRPGGAGVAGSRNWMAPERILGGALKKPVDIYAFGMTIFELFTLEVPLGNLAYGDFLDLVVNRDIRPERPDDETAPLLTDEMWSLAERCWVKHASNRPGAASVCDDLVRMIAERPSVFMSPLPKDISLLDKSSPRTSAYSSSTTAVGSSTNVRRSLPLPPPPMGSSSTGSSSGNSGENANSSSSIPPPLSQQIEGPNHLSTLFASAVTSTSLPPYASLWPVQEGNAEVTPSTSEGSVPSDASPQYLSSIGSPPSPRTARPTSGQGAPRSVSPPTPGAPRSVSPPTPGAGGAGSPAQRQTRFVDQEQQQLEQSIWSGDEVTRTMAVGSVTPFTLKPVDGMEDLPIRTNQGAISPTAIGTVTPFDLKGQAEIRRNGIGRAKVLYDYVPNATKVARSEVPLKAGEEVDVLDDNGTWWVVKKSDGNQGTAPSNYLQLLTPPSNDNGAGGGKETLKKQRRSIWVPMKNGMSRWTTTNPSSTGTTGSSTNATSNTTSTTTTSPIVGTAPVLLRAKAQYDYESPSADNYELSFKKGEVVSILDRQEKWWIARKSDLSEGIVPSNYMRILGKSEPA